MEERELAGVFARNPLEPLNALEFAPERAVIFKLVPPHNLCRAHRAGSHASREPDIAIRPAADAAEEIIVRNRRHNG